MEQIQIVETVEPEDLEKIIKETAAVNAIAIYRMQPSESLTDAEKVVWERLLNGVALGHLQEKDRDQMNAYCSAVVNAEFYRQQVHKIQSAPDFDPLDKATFTAAGKWAALKVAEEKLIISLSLKMRLTNSAFRQDETKVSDITSFGKEPWEE